MTDKITKSHLHEIPWDLGVLVSKDESMHEAIILMYEASDLYFEIQAVVWELARKLSHGKFVQETDTKTLDVMFDQHDKSQRICELTEARYWRRHQYMMTLYKLLKDY